MPLSALDFAPPAQPVIRILHLEDSARDAELIGAALLAGGIDAELDVVASRARFEAALRGAAPQLILLDYNLAGYDGRAALRAARSAMPDVPVIFVSGSLGEEAAIDCLHLGATDYVLKQRLSRLIPAVRRALSEAEQGARRRHAEAELRRSEAELQQAQAVAKLGSWTYDVAAGLYYCSAETFRIFDLEPRPALVFDDFFACVHPGDRHLLDESWQSAIIDGLPYDLIYRIVVGGREKWVHERAELRYDEDGRPTHAVGTAQDVTERERDRIALLASEHFLNATLSAVPDRIVVLDEHGRILKTNQACRDFLAMVGLPAALIEEGASYYAICDSLADRGIAGGAAAADLARQLVQGSAHGRSFEYEVLAGAAEHRWFLCRGSVFRIDERPQVVLVHTDITSRKRAEKDLRRLNVQLEQIVARRTADLQYSNLRLASKEEEIRSVVDNLLSAVLSVDEQGIVHSANIVVGQVFGFPVEDLLGRSVWRLFAQPYGDLLPARLCNSTGEVTGQHRDGTPIPLDLSVNEYQVAGRRRFTMILRDDRERARMLSELKSARDVAEQASRAKSEFLAAMSHEIRTPMNGVIGMIDVLHQTHLRSDQAEMVELMRESAYALLTVINDILDYSKIEAGRLRVELIPMSVEELVERVCGILDRMAEKAGVGLSLFVDPAIPASLVGDPNRVRQVLINLVGNAIKFSGGGAGQVAVHVRLIAPAATAPRSSSRSGTTVSAWMRRPCRGCLPRSRRPMHRRHGALGAPGSGSRSCAGSLTCWKERSMCTACPEKAPHSRCGCRSRPRRRRRQRPCPPSTGSCASSSDPPVGRPIPWPRICSKPARTRRGSWRPWRRRRCRFLPGRRCGSSTAAIPACRRRSCARNSHCPPAALRVSSWSPLSERGAIRPARSRMASLRSTAMRWRGAHSCRP
jgi:PAS domain S-box-containing protein